MFNIQVKGQHSRRVFLFACLLFFVLSSNAQSYKIQVDSVNGSKQQFYTADNAMIQYTGRIDFSNTAMPRMWSPGVYITMQFKGPSISAIIKDQELWGKDHNYLEVVIDNNERRIQTKYKTNYISVSGLTDGIHTLLICKNTESNIGYIELGGVYCDKLLKPAPKQAHKIEFIGNSITCGASSDASEIPCGKGVWQDQHNAYMAYGPVTARALHAQWHLSSVSGIGLIHSCCNMNIIMPPVFDKIEMRGDSIPWDFKKYQPDVVTVCLGQNDGIQDSATFSNAYISFVKQLRKYYPKAQLVLLTSPMADEKLKTFLKAQITAVVNFFTASGDKKIDKYFFSRSYNGGCDYHPSLEEHQLIASELTAYLKRLMRW
ncbi:SGNH/GDSL hydrolase family protein [Ferruginibacter sp.]